MSSDSPRHLTLTASTVGTVTFGRDYRTVEIINLDGVELLATADGTTPADGATGTEVLPAAIGSLTIDVHTAGPTVVKLLAGSAARASVRGLE